MNIAIISIALLVTQPAEVAPTDDAAAPTSAVSAQAEEVELDDEDADHDDPDGPGKVINLSENGGDISVHISGDNDNEIDAKILDRLTPEQLSEWLLLRESRLAADDNAPPLVATLVPLFFFVALGFLVGFPIYLRYRKHGQVQETVRMMVEKGAHIPSELLEPQNPPTPPRNDTRRGVILVTLGIGLALCLLLVDGTDGAWGIGLIPLFVGIGYIVAGRLDQGADDGSQA